MFSSHPLLFSFTQVWDILYDFFECFRGIYQEVLVIPDHTPRIRTISNKLDHFEWLWSLVDDIASEVQMIFGCESDFYDEFHQLIITTMDIADKKRSHREKLFWELYAISIFSQENLEKREKSGKNTKSDPSWETVILFFLQIFYKKNPIRNIQDRISGHKTMGGLLHYDRMAYPRRWMWYLPHLTKDHLPSYFHEIWTHIIQVVRDCIQSFVQMDHPSSRLA